jgi:hypothetical protein
MTDTMAEPQVADPQQFFGELDTTTPTPREFFLPEATPLLRFGVDTIDIHQLNGLQFYWAAGYVGGHWPTLHPLAIAYPQLEQAGRLFGYAVSASQDGDWLDCESGDASIPEVPGWLSRQFARGHKRPGVYASWDYWHNHGLYDQLAHYGGNIVRIVAHYTFVPQISHPGFDVQQYSDRYASRNVDGNVALDSLFTPAKPPPIANPLHYDRFATGPFSSVKWGNLNEREVVLEYDGARQHPDKFKTYLPLLEAKLKWLADRVYTVAHSPLGSNGKPTWGEFYRGWRYQELVHRAQGQQFVPTPA